MKLKRGWNNKGASALSRDILARHYGSHLHGGTTGGLTIMLGRNLPILRPVQAKAVGTGRTQVPGGGRSIACVIRPLGSDTVIDWSFEVNENNVCLSQWRSYSPSTAPSYELM